MTNPLVQSIILMKGREGFKAPLIKGSIFHELEKKILIKKALRVDYL